MVSLVRATAVIAVVAALTLSGCTADKASPSPSPPETAAADPVFATEEEALAAATAAYAEYQAASDMIFADGGSDPNRIAMFAKGDAIDAARTGFESFQAQGLRSVGNSTVAELELQQFAPDNQDGVGVVSVYLCLNVSGVDVLNSDGVSVVAPSRPDEQPYEVSFDLDPATTSGLIVTQRQPWSGGSVCGD